MNTTTTQFLANIFLALVAVAIFAGAQQLDIPDHSSEMAESAATQDAIKSVAARARFTAAAAQSCGNADWVEVDDNTVQCIPRKGPAKNGAVVALAEVSQ